MKLVTTLLFSALLLISAAGAQNPQTNAQELPSAPQPHFPGAPAPQQQPAAAPAAAGRSPQLTDLEPATAPETLPPQPSSIAQPDAPQAQSSTSAPAAAPAPEAAAVQSAPESASATVAPVPPPPEEGDYRIGVEVDLVNLIFTATDKHGHFIRDLKKDDIHLLDQGKPPLRIQAFESETGLPLRVGLLIDSSNSIRERFQFEQDAAIEFLHQVVRPQSDQAFVIGFDSIADLTQDFTANGDALAHGVRVLRPGGGTALHDAIYTACEKLAKSKSATAARRAIILLSDGDDNQSRHTREQAIEAALRAEVIIYVINTDVSDSNKKGDKVLMRYAEATGGRMFYPMRLQEVATAFRDIQDELRSQYVLAYKPDNFAANGAYRSIAIDVPKRNNVKIRVRKGYYAPKG